MSRLALAFIARGLASQWLGLSNCLLAATWAGRGTVSAYPRPAQDQGLTDPTSWVGGDRHRPATGRKVEAVLAAAVRSSSPGRVRIVAKSKIGISINVHICAISQFRSSCEGEDPPRWMPGARSCLDPGFPRPPLHMQHRLPS
ncbi:hypothetical protein FB567DRAFT_544669 [Paraphoma chrysanthemicola]|uniref:Secreted protein n=1 Tax=Paraphoma chrysanthemicola TaxID=798071 RepID=A0A8K0RFW8_9PLEO|nr:hypothetical protein FB567DRAFT_544669 [Paraphoma chrysanthemicola]